MAGPKSLLFLAREYPVPISTPARLRTFNWLLHLSKRFEVVLVAPARQPPSESDLDVLRGYCKDLVVAQPTSCLSPIHRAARGLTAEVMYLTAGRTGEAHDLQTGRVHQALQQQIDQRAFDVCFSERWTWGDLVLAAAPVRVLDLGELQATRHGERLLQSRNPLRRLWRARIQRLYSETEASMLSAMDLILVNDPKSRRDVLALTNTRTLVEALPPGLNTSHFKPWAGTMDPRNIVFFTSLTSPTQRDALLHLHSNILPRVRQRLGRVRLTVVANDSSPELEHLLQRDPDVHFTGSLLDPRSTLGRAAVAVLPLRIGAGSRSRLAKLLSMGIPTVATPIAVSGLDVESGEGVLVAADGDAFVAAVVQVLEDWSLRVDLSDRGRETAEARLSLEATYERLSHLLEAAAS